MKRYLITYSRYGVQYAYYSHSESHNLHEDDDNIVIYDLHLHKMMVNSLGWADIKQVY